VDTVPDMPNAGSRSIKMEWEVLHLLEGKVTCAADLAARAFARMRRSSRAAEGLPVKLQERLALISSLHNLGFWSWNATTDKVWASKHARRILGIDNHVPLARESLFAAIHPLDRAQVLQAISASARHGDTMEMELRVLGPRGEIFWIGMKARAYRNPSAVIYRVSGYVIDNPQRKRAEAECLRQQQQITHLTRVAMLGGLSGAIAHELQQPLAAILCNAQAAQLIAAQADFNLDELRRILDDIISEDKRAGQIIQHLRALFKRGERHIQPLYIANVVRDALKLARSTLAERNAQIHLRVDEHMPEVPGDRVELQQVLLNLILNACDAMSTNAADDRRIEISVALDAEQGAVRISVLDCGTGIDSDQLEHIFEPFFTTKASGLGLGLAVSRSIILAHRGRLWATNNTGRGATLHFALPAELSWVART
jgi:signal transduction histidine kinase